MKCIHCGREQKPTLTLTILARHIEWKYYREWSREGMLPSVSEPFISFPIEVDCPDMYISLPSHIPTKCTRTHGHDPNGNPVWNEYLATNHIHNTLRSLATGFIL